MEIISILAADFTKHQDAATKFYVSCLIFLIQAILDRQKVPPMLVFSKVDHTRAVMFLGLAVPGSMDLRPSEDLMQYGKTQPGGGFRTIAPA